MLAQLCYPLYWPLESQYVVVRDHRSILTRCRQIGSPTAKLVAAWAPVMCMPQWALGLFFTFAGAHPEALAVFSARCAAMCIVRKLDEVIPYTRALGLCHLIPLGLVFAWLCSQPTIGEPMPAFYAAWSDAGSAGLQKAFRGFLLFELGVIALCLFMDARDLLLHLAGYPYPCYIRDAVHAGVLQLDDERAKRKVDNFARMVGP